MSSSGGGGVPPGFRFHPTDEELLHYYLKKKISFQKFDMEVIREVDLNKIEPWDLQEKCKIGSTPQNEWYFFSHKDRKYPTGSRTNRATHAGFWKATGRDKCIRNSFNKIGMRKTLVFYRGRAPHGQKTDWIMHEYRLEDPDDTTDNADDDGWVVCRVFKKKNLFKVVAGNEGGGSSINSSSDQHPLHNNNNNNHSSINNTGSFIHRSSDNQYLFRPPQTYATFELNKSDLALHYMPPHTYSHLYQSQTPNMNISSAANAIHNHKVPLSGYDYHALSLPPDAPIMIKQLNFMTTNPREAESGLRYQSEFEVGTSGHEADRETETEGMNVNESWAVLDRLVTSHLGSVGNEESSKEAVRFENENGGSVNQMNHLSLRGEMDFWGYAGK